ncbi:ATP-dependent Clp protease adaptor protein ClpS [Leptospira ryugenii]|uniref:ATP-dependent Clp protease adaptor protein ClpS n=1 Tax=Leptospira ryugenii TaxID=1917863 RepID=A0A2P2DZ09_9LEPT|nr:ATP-dependent Clp protease adaptor ClpS [Leptospira ryugenii]GBF49860.1 ATP-dependent Clp protease adaptor protein ClpS [Leptospira ryugenii]
MSTRRKIDVLIEEDTLSEEENIYFRKVILYNDSVNEFSHVEMCLMKICFKNKKEAKMIAIEAHNHGKAVCFIGSLEECETVSEKLSNEGLTVSIQI